MMIPVDAKASLEVGLVGNEAWSGRL